MTVDPSRTVRLVESDTEVLEFLRGCRVGFLVAPDVGDEDLAFLREHNADWQAWAAFDGDEQCGTTATFPSTVTAPGGALVPASCLTSVTVLPTHTRRGHLGRLMTAQLDAAEAAGQAVSVLIAAEWPIYGRYGYGPATRVVHWALDPRQATVLGEPTGSCRLVDAATLDPIAADLLAEQEARTAGAVGRPALHRRMLLGAVDRPGSPIPKARQRVLHRDASGRPDGYAVYDPIEGWNGMASTARMEVADVIAANPIAERELWRFLISVDLVTEITWEGDPGTLLPHVLVDGRAATTRGSWDHIWCRLIDVPAALTARSYLGADDLVIDVTPSRSGGGGGRFRLEVGDGEVRCRTTDATPDVTVPLGALGAAWLGETDLRAIAAGDAGLSEARPGALERLARLLHWPEVPYSATDF